MRREGVKKCLPYPYYDLIICPVSSPTEDCLDLIRHMHAPEKWGFSGISLNIHELENEANQPERVFTSCYKNTSKELWEHELDRTRKSMEFFDIRCEDNWPEFWLSEEDASFAACAVPEGGTMGIFIGTSHWQRRWGAAKWKQLLETQNVAEHVVIFGSGENEALAREICSSGGGRRSNVTNLAGKTTLRQLAACVRRCRCFVSTDSCGLHFAVGMRIPTVGILGGYHYGRFYPWGDPRINRVACVQMDCYHCNDICLYEDLRCVQEITPETVLNELVAAMRNGEDMASAPLKSIGTMGSEQWGIR
jgi:ADP-heptose:LPS heptosyltransferase